VLLITCCSAEDDAMGAWLTLHGPRGVIHITRGVIDKAGLNRLLVPHQSPFSPLNQSSLLLTTTMSHYTNTYTIPFNPVHNGSGECAITKESFNRQWFVNKRGSKSTPYPAFVDVYWRSAQTFVESDPFDDLFLADFVESNKRYGGVECWLLCLCLLFQQGFPTPLKRRFVCLEELEGSP
jgi:hypothetical protein